MRSTFAGGLRFITLAACPHAPAPSPTQAVKAHAVAHRFGHPPLFALDAVMPFGTRESDFDSFTLLTGSASRAGRRGLTAEPPGCAPLGSTRSSMSTVMRPGVGPAADLSP